MLPAVRRIRQFSEVMRSGNHSEEMEALVVEYRGQEAKFKQKEKKDGDGINSLACIEENKPSSDRQEREKELPGDGQEE